jgi:hypothetical protein
MDGIRDTFASEGEWSKTLFGEQGMSLDMLLSGVMRGLRSILRLMALLTSLSDRGVDLSSSNCGILRHYREQSRKEFRDKWSW